MKKHDPGLVDKRKGRSKLAGVKAKGYVRRSEQKSPMPVTPKDYEMRVKLIRLYELLQLQIPVSQIATLMKSPESTVRSWIDRLQSDFSSLIQTEEAKNIIDENIAGWTMAMQKVLTILTTTNEGDARRLQAAQILGDLRKKKADYEVTVGRVKKAPDDLRLAGRMGINSNQVADLDELGREVSMADLEDLFITVGARFSRDRKQITKAVQGNVIDVPAIEDKQG